MNTERAFYRIQVQGKLNASWSDRLGGMTIRPSDVAPESITTLFGKLPDQSALRGVIDSLVDMQCKVLTVDRIQLDPDDSSD